MCPTAMAEPTLQVYYEVGCSNDMPGMKKAKCIVSDVLSRAISKKSRVKDTSTLENILETCDNATYNKTITAIADSLLKRSSEILFPTPVDSQDGAEASAQQSPSHDRLKYTHPFSCPICDFVLNEPVTLLCGHTYCKKCLIKWKPNACRLCKKKLYANPCELSSAQANVLVSSLVKRWWQPELSASSLRDKGNQCVSSQSPQQDYAKALQYYSDALELAPHDHITLSNRSHVLNKMSRNHEALRDAETAIQMQPFWAKGYFRQAAALRSLGRLEDALVAYVMCATLEETPTATAVFSELQQLLKRILRRRRPSDGHASKVRRRSDSQTEMLHHSDDSNSSTVRPAPSCSQTIPLCEQFAQTLAVTVPDEGCSPSARPQNTLRTDHPPQNRQDVPSARPSESRTNSADQKLRRIEDRCRTAVHALKCREGKQFVRTVAEEARPTRDDFECSLCYRLLWQPASTPCGHTFCRSCIDRWLDHSPTCPLCKMALDEYLAERGRSTTTFLTFAMESLLPAEVAERRRTHEEEILADSLAGQDRHHEIPIFVCTLAFPTLPCPLHVFEPRYRLMVRRCMESGTREFGMCTSSQADPNGFADIGVMLEIRDLHHFPDGRSVVDAVGSRRFRCLEKGMRDGYSTARAEFLTDQAVPPEGMQELQQLHDQVRGLVETWWTEHFREEKRARVISFFGQMPNVETNYWTLPAGPSWLWWSLAILPMPQTLQLEILGMTSLKRRLRVIGNVLRSVLRRAVPSN